MHDMEADGPSPAGPTEVSRWTAALDGGRVYAVRSAGVEVMSARRGQRIIPLVRRTADGAELPAAFDVAPDEPTGWDGSPREATEVVDGSFPRAAGGEELQPGDVVSNGEAPETVARVESFGENGEYGWMVILETNGFTLGPDESAVLLGRSGIAPPLSAPGLEIVEMLHRATGAR